MEDDALLIDNTLKKIEFLFRYNGINIRSGEQRRKNPFWSRCIYVINLFWLGFDLYGCIYFTIDGIRNKKNFLGLAFIAPSISMSFLAIFKGIFLTLHEKNVHKLIDNIRKLEKVKKKRNQSTVKEDIAEKESKFLNFVVNMITTLYAFVIAAFSLSPFVLMAVKYHQTKQLETILPFPIWYPFDAYEIKIWPFVYFHQFWSECIVTISICSADYFFFCSCTYLHMQFRWLQHDLETIIPTKEHLNRNVLVCEDEDFRQKFKDLIIWHQDLIESANILEIIYTKSTLLNFLVSSMVICLAGFNVTAVKDVAPIVIFLGFLFMGLAQVFFLCFFADLLMTSSMEVSDAAYRSQWYMAELKIRKKMLLVQTRSQKPCQLTAFGFAEVNLKSFMSVLSTAWSYFALLQTMYGD